MLALSTFQQLPLHIAEAISGYYFPPFPHYSEDRWLVIYDISYSWRTLALQHFYQNAIIIASAEVGAGKIEFPDKPSQLETDTMLFGCVKGVEVRFKHESGNIGMSQLNNFSSTWPENLIFQTARSLRINLTGFFKHWGAINETLEKSEFMWVVQRIGTLMPNLRKATVFDSRTKKGFDQWSLSGTHWTVGNLLSATFGRATTVHISSEALRLEDIHRFEFDFSKLVGLEFNCGRNVKLLNYIAKKSSATLETMQIRDYPFQTIKSLVVDNEGHPVVFPHLHQLHFHSSSTWDEPESAIQIDKSVAIFPALRRLAWMSKYTFANDELFRGNSNTLECLDIALDTDLSRVLGKYGVFSAGRFPRLSHVKIRDGRSDTHSNSDNELRQKHMARLFSPATQHLTILGEGAYQEINDVVFKVAILQNIQVLNIDFIKIKFFEMLDLIKQLPNLTRLRSSSLTIYSELQPGICRMGEFMEDAYKDYYQLNRCFKLWIHEPIGYRFMEHIALASIVLAVLCPKFVYTKVPNSKQELYQYTLKEAISNFSNSQHLETLQRLYRRSVEHSE